IKGKKIEEARELISSFKELMNIHESKLETGNKSQSQADSSDALKLGELDALTGVVKFPVRIKCATLAFNTLGNGLDSAQGVSKPAVASTE
ncbi:MAG TPA: hypothetical protein PLT55_02230, partial [Acidimicrobiia bacterium]|nr:hypothetical protein [Acidimicrobiia bacterium]